MGGMGDERIKVRKRERRTSGEGWGLEDGKMESWYWYEWICTI